MAMNREQKRLLQKQGVLDAQGEPAARARQSVAAPKKRERTSPRQFIREMWAELRKVAWPTRTEVINYSSVVLVFLVVFTTFVSLIDWGLAKAVLRLFGLN